jgi:hypothetical protein
MHEARQLLTDVDFKAEPLRGRRRTPTRWCIITEWDQFRALDLDRREVYC